MLEAALSQAIKLALLIAASILWGWGKLAIPDLCTPENNRNRLFTYTKFLPFVKIATYLLHTISNSHTPSYLSAKAETILFHT